MLSVCWRKDEMHTQRREDFSKLRIALVADELTSACLKLEADVIEVSPWDFWWKLKKFKPDFLFVESAWRACNGKWKFRIADYPEHPLRSNRMLKLMVNYAKQKRIPTVFWNKEDPVHFYRFINSAKLFDYIFTVDQNSIEKYKKIVKNNSRIFVLPFSVQPRIHKPIGHDIIVPKKKASFVGSYHKERHPKRREMQRMLFEAFSKYMEINVYDRNYYHKWDAFRFPDDIDLHIHPAVKHEETPKIYYEHLANLNVNTVVDSPTMFSRRLIEIMSCARLAVTTPALSVRENFSECCYIVSNSEEAQELANKLSKDGIGKKEIEMMKNAANVVLEKFTWNESLKKIVSVVSRYK